MIVEDDQNGKERANYATETLNKLSQFLTKDFGKGYSVVNFQSLRAFFIEYRNYQTVSVISDSVAPNYETVSRNLHKTFNLSWSHYVQLLKVKDKIKQLAQKGHIMEKSADTLKSPLVLGLLGLSEDSRYIENYLGTAIINKLEHFMLELGKGFLFEGRQRRITLVGDHFYVHRRKVEDAVKIPRGFACKSRVQLCFAKHLLFPAIGDSFNNVIPSLETMLSLHTSLDHRLQQYNQLSVSAGFDRYIFRYQFAAWPFIVNRTTDINISKIRISCIIITFTKRAGCFSAARSSMSFSLGK